MSARSPRLLTALILGTLTSAHAQGLFGQDPAAPAPAGAPPARLAPAAAPVVESPEVGHFIHVDPTGVPRSQGENATPEAFVRAIFRERIAAARKEGCRAVLIHAHGGLVKEGWGTYKARQHVEWLAGTGVYPIVMVWPNHKDDVLPRVAGKLLAKLPGFLGRTAEGVLDGIDDWVDDALGLPPDDIRGHTPEAEKPTFGELQIEEALRRNGLGAIWQEMLRHALAATLHPRGALRIVAEELARIREEDPGFGIHLTGHSAGSVMLAPFAQLLATEGAIRKGPMQGERGLGETIQTVQLRGAAIDTVMADRTYRQLRFDRRIEELTLFNLTPRAELDDTLDLEVVTYTRSILYLVKWSLGEVQGRHLLGLQAAMMRSSIGPFVRNGTIDVVECPSAGCGADSHFSLADDETMLATNKARILRRITPSSGDTVSSD